MEEERSGGELGQGEGLRREKFENYVEEKEQWDVGCAALGHSEKRVKVMHGLDGSHALGDAIFGKDEVDHARSGEGEANEDCLGARHQRSAVGEVYQGPGETGYELWGVLVGKCELEGEGRQNESNTAADGERGGKPVERLHELPVDPEVCEAHKSPEVDRLGVQEDLHDIWVTGKFLAGLVPASDDSRRHRGEKKRCQVAHF